MGKATSNEHIRGFRKNKNKTPTDRIRPRSSAGLTPAARGGPEKSRAMHWRRVSPTRKDGLESGTHDVPARPRMVQNRHGGKILLSRPRRVFQKKKKLIISNPIGGGRGWERTGARDERRHADEFQAGGVRAELVELQLVLFRNSWAPAFRWRCADARFLRRRECRAVRRDAREGAGADSEDGEKEEALVLPANVSRLSFCDNDLERGEGLTRVGAVL